MNNLQTKTKQILDYARQSSASHADMIEIALYSIFLKYCELQDKNERTVSIENFSHVFTNGYVLEWADITRESAKFSVENFIASNVDFFDNKSFGGHFTGMFTETIFDRNHHSAFLSIVKVIDEITEKQELIETFESLLSQFQRTLQREGLFSGNDNVHKIISGVLGMKGGTVYDPACGVGQLLVEIQKNTEQKIEFYGKEINTRLYGLAKLNFYIHGLSGDLQIGDTFANNTNENIQRFDYTVCEVPFGMRHFENPWIEHIISSLNDAGKGAILLPTNSLILTKTLNLRKEIIESGFLESIIVLPSGLLSNTGISTSLWIINKKERNRNVLFVDGRKSQFVSGSTISRIFGKNFEEFILEITETLKSRKDDYISKIVPIEEIKNNEYILDPQSYIEGLSKNEILQKRKIGISREIKEENEKMCNPDTPSEEKEQSAKNIDVLQKDDRDIDDDQRKNLNDRNYKNIGIFNDQIHDKLKSFSDIIKFSNEEICPKHKFLSLFLFNKIDNKKVFEFYAEKTKDSLRLLNIMSLNLYIEHLPDGSEEKTKKQFELVKYFDDHLAKEWLLRTKNAYANRLFWFLVIESIALLCLIIWAVRSENKDFIEFIKIFASVGLGQIALMVAAIVTHLFPKNGSKTVADKNTSGNLLHEGKIES